LKNNPDKFHPDFSGNDAALGFSKSVAPTKSKNDTEQYTTKS